MTNLLLKKSLEKLIFKTKDEKPIQFNFYNKVQDEAMQKFWTVHLLAAYIEDEPAGYIKVSYISKKDMDIYFPNLFSYLRNIKNISHKNHDEISDFDKNIFIKQFNDFKLFYQNKPKVDFIKVYDENDDTYCEIKEKKIIYSKRNKKFSMKEKNIGSSLYEMMRSILDENNLSLSTSDINEEDALTVWRRLDTSHAYIVKLNAIKK